MTWKICFSDPFSIPVRALLLCNIQLAFTITHTHFVLFQLHLNHQIDINQNPQLKPFGTCGLYSLNQENAKGHSLFV